MLCNTHVSQVQDKTVSLVETVPAHSHLCGPDGTPTFDLQQPLNHHLVGDDVFEPRGHASILSD